MAIGPITPEMDPPALRTAERFIRTQDGESYDTDSRYVVDMDGVRSGARVFLRAQADFLILDEPTAHLDATNFEVVGQLMRSFGTSVQFLLATPTSGQERRLVAWSDLVVGFTSRTAREPYSPPVQLRLSQRAVLEQHPGLPADATGARP